MKENLPLLRKKAWYSKTRHGYARGDEPVKYVDNIRRYYETLVWLDQQRSEQQNKGQQQVAQQDDQPDDQVAPDE